MKTLSTILFISFLLLSACSDDEINIVDNPLEDEIDLYQYEFYLQPSKDFGSTKTKFDFLIKEKTDVYPSLDSSTIKFDFDNDGIYEIGSNLFSLSTVLFNSANIYNIKANIMVGERSFNCSAKVIVVEPIVLMESTEAYIFEPHIFNSKKISFTSAANGIGHHGIQIMNLDGSNVHCLFCDVGSINYHEQHCSLISFDESKLIFNNQGTLRYYDLIANDGTIKDLFKPGYYEVGKVCWGSNSDKFYFINDSKYGINYLSTDDFSIHSFANLGEFVCSIPSKNQLAVLTHTNPDLRDNLDTLRTCNLHVYDETTSIEVAVYNNIPGYGPFRIIDNGTKLFFEKPMMIYNLETQKEWYIDFDELDLSTHSIGESDISSNGKQLIFSLFNNDNNRSLYSVDIPIESL